MWCKGCLRGGPRTGIFDACRIECGQGVAEARLQVVEDMVVTQRNVLNADLSQCMQRFRQ